MVTVADKEIDGLEELKQSIAELKNLLGNVFVATNGCNNTNELSINLIETYSAILKLEKALKNLL